MKIAHLSDLHFSRKFKANNIKKFKKLIKFAMKEGFDHLIITGDISDNADVKDFEILKGFLINNDLWDPQKVTLTVGNHDIFGGVQTALDVVNFTSKCKNTDYDKNLSLFLDYFKDLAEDSLKVNNLKFPFCKVVGGIAIFVLNSIDRFSKLKNPFASNGKIYKDQYDALETLFQKKEVIGKQKIIAVHHHFYKNNVEATSSQSQIWNAIESYTLKLRGKKKLLSLFKKYGADIVLHGHSHELVEYFRKGIRFINAGAAIDNYNPEHAAIFFLEIENDMVKVNLKNLNDMDFTYSKEKLREFLAPSLASKSV